jgi:hypothetical protein
LNEQGVWGLFPSTILVAGPVRAFAPKIAKLNTKSPPQGEGGLNLWHLGPRYRMGTHAQIFYGRQRFDLFSEIKDFKRQVDAAAAYFYDSARQWRIYFLRLGSRRFDEK